MWENNEDPILNDLQAANEDLFEEGKVEFPVGVERFLKTWHGAEIAEVTSVAKSDKQFRHRVKVKFYLTPENLDEPTAYTGSLDLPVTAIEGPDADKYQKAIKGNASLKAKLNALLGTFGLLPKGQIFSKNVDDQATYERLVSLLKAGSGKRGSIKISRQRRLNKESGKWEDTDFTQFEGVANQ